MYCYRLHAWWSPQSWLATLLSSLIAVLSTDCQISAVDLAINFVCCAMSLLMTLISFLINPISSLSPLLSFLRVNISAWALDTIVWSSARSGLLQVELAGFGLWEVWSKQTLLFALEYFPELIISLTYSNGAPSKTDVNVWILLHNFIATLSPIFVFLHRLSSFPEANGNSSRALSSSKSLLRIFLSCISSKW